MCKNIGKDLVTNVEIAAEQLTIVALCMDSCLEHLWDQNICKNCPAYDRVHSIVGAADKAIDALQKLRNLIANSHIYKK